MPAKDALALAVLGDSDSESYAGERGGAYAHRTLQWTEVLGRLRGESLDLGPWGTWGLHGKLTKLWRGAGLPVGFRAPRKHDYEHDFAISGSRCSDLMDGWREVPQLLRLMDRQPARWERGVVVIRIGVNDLAKQDPMDALAADPAAPAVHARIDSCLSDIRAAVAAVHARHPRTRFVLVGMYNLADWPTFHDRWRSAEAVSRIAQGLDRFDRALAAMASDPRIAFFDDRAFFARHWGGRGPDGMPAYHPARLGEGFMVSPAIGDEPSHAALEDGHIGTAWNAMWAAALVDLLNERFGAGLEPLQPQELLALLGAAA